MAPCRRRRCVRRPLTPWSRRNRPSPPSLTASASLSRWRGLIPPSLPPPLPSLSLPLSFTARLSSLSKMLLSAAAACPPVHLGVLGLAYKPSTRRNTNCVLPPGSSPLLISSPDYAERNRRQVKGPSPIGPMRPLSGNFLLF
jgi:hypothetical protein